MVPLVYKNLLEHCRNTVPAHTLERLRQLDFENTVRNVRFVGSLVGLCDIFERRQIPVLVFKGAALAYSAYGDLRLRQFGDIDLLAHERHLPDVRRVLVSTGFRQTVDFGWEATFSDGKGVLVDLHNAIAPPRFPVSFDVDRLWERADRFTARGQKIPTLCPQDALLTLCVQITRDCSMNRPSGEIALFHALKLAQICDIAELLRSRPGLDWEALHEEALNLGAERMLTFGLSLSREFFGWPESIQPAGGRRSARVGRYLAATARSSLLSTRNESFTLLRARMRFDVDVLKCGRVELIRRLLAPDETDKEAVKLPAFLAGLYYVVHPVRVVARYFSILADRQPGVLIEPDEEADG